MITRIHNRIDALVAAFSWSLCEGKTLTVGERICISQERASWMRVLNALGNGENPPSPNYLVSDEINRKVDEINVHITKTGWKKPHITEHI